MGGYEATRLRDYKATRLQEAALASAIAK